MRSSTAYCGHSSSTSSAYRAVRRRGRHGTDHGLVHRGAVAVASHGAGQHHVVGEPVLGHGAVDAVLARDHPVRRKMFHGFPVSASPAADVALPSSRLSGAAECSGLGAVLAGHPQVAVDVQVLRDGAHDQPQEVDDAALQQPPVLIPGPVRHVDGSWRPFM